MVITKYVALAQANLFKIRTFVSLSFVLSLVKGSNASPFETRSGDLMTCYRLTNQKISCKCFGAVGKLMLLHPSIDFHYIFLPTNPPTLNWAYSFKLISTDETLKHPLLSLLFVFM